MTRSRCVALLLSAALLVLGLVHGPAVSAAAPPQDLLDTVTLSPHGCPCPDQLGTTQLQAGSHYTLVVTGTYTTFSDRGGSLSSDGLYDYASSGFVTVCATGCPRREEVLVVGIKGHPYAAIDRSPIQNIPYAPQHTYTASFVPLYTGVLYIPDVLGYGGGVIPPSGGLTVQVFGTPPPMTWAMPDRFGSLGQDGLVNYFTTTSEINPHIWPVDMTVPGCQQSKLGTYQWKVDGQPPAETQAVSSKPCTVAVDVGKLGPHTVTAKAPDGTENTAQVLARDFLIVGLGDSNGSGEGTPDIPGYNVKWEDVRCDRSAKSFEAQTAEAIEQQDQQSSVTFVHLACSGATVVNGLLGPYAGINPPAGQPPLPSQLSALGQLIGNRKVDAVELSIGVNDLKFGPMTAFCLQQTGCQDKKYPDSKSPVTLDTWMKQHVAALPGLYDQVAARFDRLGIPGNRIYISQYFDSTRDQNGNTCNPLMAVYGVGIFARSEADWAYNSVLVPLNNAVATAAAKHGWHLISGAPQAFHTHGYCSTTPWISTLAQSLANQHDQNGTLHANEIGQHVDSVLAQRVLLPDLFPGGKPRPS